MAEYLSQTDFAKLVNVSRAAITKAIREGRVHRTKRGIDPNHPTNQYYTEKQKERKPKNKNGKKGRKASARKPKKKQTKKKAARAKAPSPPAINKPAGPGKPQADNENKDVNDLQYEDDSDVVHKAEAETRRIKAQTRKINITVAEKMRTLILREDVTKAFGKIYSVSVNHFLTMGDRLSPIITGICGTSDPKITIKVKEKIDSEITRALEEIKRVAVEGI